MIPLVVAGAESQKVADPGSPKGIPRVVWDSRDRLVEVKSGGVTVGTYKYDVNGLRVGINDAGGERRILLDGIEELAEYEAGAMSQVNRWDRDPTRVDALLAQVAGGKHHAVTDALGSVYGMTDSTGAVVNRASFDAYGARTTTTATVPTDRGFTGRRHDPTGAMYYRARYYEPGVGRWTALDPLRNEERLRTSVRRLDEEKNTYVYALNDPAQSSDPLGLFSPPIHREITTGILGAWRWRPEFVEEAARCNVDQDRLSNFGANDQHGMRDVGEQYLDAVRRWSRYVNQQMAAAQSFACSGNRLAAACALGRGLHAVQDRWAHNFISLPGHLILNPAHILADWFPPDPETLVFADLESWEYVERFTYSNGLIGTVMQQ